MSKYAVQKTEDEWKKELTEEQFRILREKGTEYPHSGKYNLHFEEGTYRCAACKQALFSSETKFESDCGWPSFDKALENSVEFQRDTSFGMIRVEVLCKNCGGHLGHIFPDGPTQTGERYCINSASLKFYE